ncbi:hypothetical protein P5V15_001689 [Pogonomyrmex californicus]
MVTAGLRLNTPTFLTFKKHVVRRSYFRKQRVTMIVQIEGQSIETHFSSVSASNGCLVYHGCSLARHFHTRGDTRDYISVCLPTSMSEESALLVCDKNENNKVGEAERDEARQTKVRHC